MSRARGKGRVLNWRAGLGIGISVALLYFAFRGVHFGEVAREISRADPVLFVLSSVAATLVFVIRAWRWRPLVAPVADTSFRSRFAAVNIGFMANNLLPARVGEFVRAYALARAEPISISASFGSLVIERLFDSVAVVGSLVLIMALPSFPAVPEIGGVDLRNYGYTLLALVGVAVLLLALMVRRPQGSIRLADAVLRRLLPQSFRRPVVDALRAFVGGLSVLRSPALLLSATMWTIVLWTFNAFGFWLAFLAFDIDVPFTAAFFLQSVVSTAVAVPSAPGFFGVWEYAARQGLAIWGVPASKAVGFAVGFHIAGFIPVTVIGLIYAWRMGLSLQEVKRSEEVVETAVETEHPEEGLPEQRHADEGVIEDDEPTEAARRPGRTDPGAASGQPVDRSE